MIILVTGGTGVIGEGLIPALLEAGHTVRLLSRGAEDDAKQWPEGVEPFAGDVTDAKGLRGAASDCSAVIHITGIVEESPPRLTFERVNVKGTKNILNEAARSGVKRFLYVSSLGAERGSSDYHRSKFRAEEAVRSSKMDWTILRPGNVYGPGDEVLSTLLKLIRTLPAVPVINAGDQQFQPVWYEDLGQAIVRALDAHGLERETLELAGEEITTMNDIVERLKKITGRSVTSVPIPSFLASLGVRIAELVDLEKLLGMKVPLSDAKLKMLLEENVIGTGTENALTVTLSVRPTPLDDGLRMLADMIPEQLPSEGVGPMEHKRFWADIEGSAYSPAELLEAFRLRCAEVMPLEFSAEPGAQQVVEKGATLTLALPLRGNVQVRVEEVSPLRITFSTVEGHMLAGTVRFIAGKQKKAVRFMVEVQARAANNLDLLAIKTVGSAAQNSNWEEVVERVVELSNGTAPEGVQSDSTELDDSEAERVEEGMAELVNARKRDERKGLAKSSKKRGAKKAAKKRAKPGSKSRVGSKRVQPKGRAVAAKKSDNALPEAADAISSLAASAVRGVASLAAQTLKAIGGRKAGKKKERKARG